MLADGISTVDSSFIYKRVLSEETFYRHISKKGLNFSTKASMVISD